LKTLVIIVKVSPYVNMSTGDGVFCKPVTVLKYQLRWWMQKGSISVYIQ